MPYHRIVLASFLFAGAAAATQTAAPPAAPVSSRPASDSWNAAPASPASNAHQATGAVREAAGEAPAHFKFKQRRHWEPADNPAQQHSGKAPISGSSLMGADGRPPVDCVRTPMDSACR